MVRCKIVSTYQRTHLIGSYIPPSTLDHLPDLEEVVNHFPGRHPVVLEDLPPRLEVKIMEALSEIA